MNLSTIKRRLPSSALALLFALFTTVLVQAQSADRHHGLTNRLIVKYKDSATVTLNQNMSAVAQLSSRAGFRLQHLRAMAGGAHVLKLERFHSEQEVAAMATRLQADPSVDYAEPDRMLQPLFIPDDPGFDLQWHYYEATGGLNLPDAWDISTGSGAVVAVVDTGFRPHVDLAGNLLPGYDMISDSFVAQDGDGRDSDAADEGDATTAGECGNNLPPTDQSSSWHGTHVAGTVAALTHNGSGVAGVAFDAKVVPVRALGKCGGFTSDIADSIVWAAGGNVSGVPANPNPSQVINLSLGGLGSCGNTSQNAINSARALGATVVVAAGNESINASNATPANCSGVVTVAATNRNGSRASYSNFGSVVDVAAPGGDFAGGVAADGVLSTVNDGQTGPGSDAYAYFQGTSMAAPHVAGAAALLYSVDPGVTPDQVEAAIKSTARAFPGSCSGCGTGIVDATALLNDSGDNGDPGVEALTNGSPVSDLSGTQGSEVVFSIEVPEGASNLEIAISGGSGDADLYVRFGAQPTVDTFDCRPYLGGNNESCSAISPQTGTYFIMIRGFSTYSGVSLVAGYDEPGQGGGSGGFSESNLSGATGSFQYFSIDVPAGTANLSVAISSGSGDADLYVRFGSEPTRRRFDCRPYLNGNNESCSFDDPAAGTWYIGIRAYRSYSGVNLDVGYTD